MDRPTMIILTLKMAGLPLKPTGILIDWDA